jgi:hypothetical protein
MRYEAAIEMIKPSTSEIMSGNWYHKKHVRLPTHC